MKANIITNLISFYNIENISKVDINTIISNAKNDRRFNKLLGLCIKYDIHIFYQNNDKCVLVDVDNLLLQSQHKQKNLTKDLADNINVIYTNSSENGIFFDIESLYNKYKKKIKDIDLIIYILKHIYDNNILENLCCIKEDINSSSPICKNKYQKINKYIAVYSN